MFNSEQSLTISQGQNSVLIKVKAFLSPFHTVIFITFTAI
jgi:hypothetical protein